MLLPKPRATLARRGGPRSRGAQRPRLVALGDLVLDIAVRPEGALVRGSDVPGQIGFRAGGSAANACRAFVELGGRATFIGALGDDAWGRRLAASLRRDGVSLRVVRVSQPTARLLALLDPLGERSFVTQRGAADRLRAAHVRREWLAGCDVLHLPAYSLLADPLRGAAMAALGHARAAGALVSLDLASRGPLLSLGRRQASQRFAQLGPDVLLANLDEADALVGRGNERRLLEFAPLVVLKEGSAGCRVIWRARSDAPDVLELDVATASIEAADSTGAGDAFDAGFLYSLVATGDARPDAQAHSVDDRRQALRRGQSLRRAAVAGHRAAARALQRARPELVL